MKTIKKTLLLFALLFVFCVVSNSQEIEKEKTFNQPFEQSQIELFKTYLNTTTNLLSL